MEPDNPFEYEAALSLRPERISSWFIDDFNYARFIRSRRNVVLNGDRGSGKTMILAYYSAENDIASAKREGREFDTSHIGIYVPCNNPLLKKPEHDSLPPEKRDIISERYLIYTICSSIAKTMSSLIDRIEAPEREEILEEFAYLMPDINLTEVTDPFTYLSRFIRSRLRADQEALANGLEFEFNFETSSFFVLVMPILAAIREASAFERTHFSLHLDDAHMLDGYQQGILNSWLGYRDHSLFSLKVAIAGMRNYSFKTAYGGAILNGHDYTYVSLYRPFQNLESEYGKFVKRVVERRLKDIGVPVEATEFFPPSANFVRDLDNAKDRAEQLAIERGIDPKDRRAMGDFRYKFSRALYFRDRSRRANRPPYSGFETITHLSTGVVRNLLNLCYTMFEKQQSKQRGKLPQWIEPEVQAEAILEASDEQWRFVKEELDRSIPHCTPQDTVKISNLLTRLAEYFRQRLLNHYSEPRVLVFSISALDRDRHAELLRLLYLAEEAQLVYVRTGVAKSGGGRENYYVLNRILFPAYGLDVQGQNGRASLKADDLLAAAEAARSIPMPADEEDPPLPQGELFDV
jgi:hypothetical protein